MSTNTTTLIKQITKTIPERKVIVAGAFNEENHQIGMSILEEHDGIVVSHQGLMPIALQQEYETSKKVAGEIYAVMSAINQAIKDHVALIEIGYHYIGVENWATGEWNVNSKIGTRYQLFIQQAQHHINIQFAKITNDDTRYQEAYALAQEITESKTMSQVWQVETNLTEK